MLRARVRPDLRPLPLVALVALQLACATAQRAADTGDVREIMQMADALASVGPDTLVVLDIDNTMIEPVGMLGSDQWFYHLLDRAKAEGVDEDVALTRVMDLWNAVQLDLEVKSVEATTPALLGALAERGVVMMALTARTHASAPATVRQLASAGLDLGPRPKGWPTATTLEGLDVVIEGPVVYVGEKSSKGEVLVAFLRKANLTSKRIVFVDDKPKHAASVGRALAAAGIAHTSYRYGAADARVAAFDPDAAAAELALWQAQHAAE
ncbi:DUF2608 domain-containing protein [Myxococcota bacterium]|nr:DUF2608 domain-containing protein [Myxococcota bacterium]